MAKVNNKKKFINAAKKEVANNSLYLWGGQGEPVLTSYTPAAIIKRETSRENAARVLRKLSTLLGSNSMTEAKYFDCSGLVIYILMCVLGLINKDYTAAGIYAELCEPISSEEISGADLAFKRENGRITHVAIIVDSLYIVEARGRDYGVVMRPFVAKEFNCFGRLKCLK